MGLFDIFKKKDKKPSSVSPSPPTIKEIPNEILEKSFDEVVDEFVEGKLSKTFPSNLILKKDERLIFDIPEIELCEDRVVKSGGGYMGFSVRIMKGVSMRVGGFQGGVEKQVSPIDEGNFILTNKRIVFVGEKKSVEFLLSHINTIEVLDHGFTLSRKRKTKTEYYVGFDVVSIKMTLTPDKDEGQDFDEKMVEWKLTGEEVKKIIQKLLQE